jgi:hypothetical protein
MEKTLHLENLLKKHNAYQKSLSNILDTGYINLALAEHYRDIDDGTFYGGIQTNSFYFVAVAKLMLFLDNGNDPRDPSFTLPSYLRFIENNFNQLIKSNWRDEAKVFLAKCNKKLNSNFIININTIRDRAFFHVDKNAHKILHKEWRILTFKRIMKTYHWGGEVMHYFSIYINGDINTIEVALWKVDIKEYFKSKYR